LENFEQLGFEGGKFFLRGREDFFFDRPTDFLSLFRRQRFNGLKLGAGQGDGEE